MRNQANRYQQSEMTIVVCSRWLYPRPEFDSALCWLMVIAGFIVTTIISGVTYSFGIIYVAILQEFPGTESETAWIMSINWGTVMLSSPVTIFFCKRLTTRITCVIGLLLGGVAFCIASYMKTITMLYLTIGIMHGLGTSLSYISVLYLMRRNFRRHLDLACGISLAGLAVGGIIFGLILPTLIDALGWRHTIRVCGYITMVTTVFCVTFVECSAEQPIKETKSQRNKCFIMDESFFKLSSDSPWRNNAFIVLMVAMILGGFAGTVHYCHAVNFGIKQGLDKPNASKLSTFISIGSFMGRVGVGKLPGLFGMTRLFIVQMVLLVQAVITTLATLATTSPTLLLYACVFGAMDGSFGIMLGVVMDDLFSDKHLSLKAMGYLLFIFALPYLLGSPFAGWIYEITQDYHKVYYLCGAINFLASCLISLVQCLRPTIVSEDSKVIITMKDYIPTLSETSSLKPGNTQRIASKTCSISSASRSNVTSSALQRQDKCCVVNNDNLLMPRRYSNDFTSLYTDIGLQISGLKE